MNLKETLLEEHSKAQCNRIVKYIGGDKKKFSVLMKLFFEGEYRVTQRAAWPVSYVVSEHPELADPYLSKMVRLLDRTDLHDAVTRNILRLLQEVEIPRRLHGRVMNRCFEFIQSVETPAAMKAFSLTILHKLSEQYPDIGQELKFIIHDRWEHESAAFRSRARKILKSL